MSSAAGSWLSLKFPRGEYGRAARGMWQLKVIERVKVVCRYQSLILSSSPRPSGTKKLERSG